MIAETNSQPAAHVSVIMCGQPAIRPRAAARRAVAHVTVMA
jgi:hypothetical protein